MDQPFTTSGLSAEEISRFQNTYDALKEKSGIQFTGHIDFNLEQFEVFKPYLDVITRNSYVLKQDNNNDSYVLFVETHLKKRNASGVITDHYEHQTWALAYLKNDFGRVLIRPETLRDKLIELIHPVELDFSEDKAFSDTFSVLVNDHEKAVKAINRNFRNAVMDIRADDFIIEIVNHTLIVGNRKPLSSEKAIHMAEFVKRVCYTCF